MLNHRQRMILEEAAKHGGANISVPEQMARAINEAKTTMSFDEIVAEIKSSLKASFPKHTFSVRRGMATYTPHLTVTLIAGPTAFSYEPDGTPSKSVQINRWHTDYYKQSKEFTDKVVAIVTKRHWDESDISTDYSHTNFYISIDQGANTRPFVLTDASGKKPLDTTQKIRPSTAWQGKTLQIKGLGGKPITVAADNAYGSAMRFSKKETAQAFSDKHKLGGIIASATRRSLYYVLVNPPVKEEVEVTEQLANYRAFNSRTGQQITVQASSTREAEAKAVEALKAANKKSVYVYYLGPVKEEVNEENLNKEEVEVTESINVQTAKRRFANFQYKKSSKTVSGDSTEFVLHGVKENELRSIFGAPKSSGGMKQWSFEHDRPLDHQFTIEFDGSDAYINSSRKGNPTVRDHIKGVFGLMGLRVTTESVEEDGEELTEAQQVIGKYRFTSFTEGSVKGWLISVQGMGEVGFVSEPAKRNTKMSVAPHQVFFHKSFQGAGNPSLMANFYPGTETRVPNEKEVRFAPRQLLKAVAMWMDKYGYEKIEHAKKEEVNESVSMPRDQRIARVKQNQDKIDRIKAYIAAKGLPLELQDTVGKRLPWLATDNQRLGTEEWLKRGPSAWVNQEGLYVGREIDRIINVLKHHGITIPHLESADQGGEMVSEYYRRGGFRSSSYSGDPRWITAKYAGVDAHGKPFKKGEEVLYFPNGKKFYTGAEAEKAWREFLSAKGDEMGMPYAS